MIASLAGSIVAASCMGCTAIPDSSEIIHLDLGPVSETATLYDDRQEPFFPTLSGGEYRLPLKSGNDFSPSNWGRADNVARFAALDLSTPLPIRVESGGLLSAEVSIGASADRTGLGFDVAFTRRAQVQRNLGGANVSREGAEVRLGRNLTDRDQRGTKTPAPSWYFFIGADNEALVWNIADKDSLDGLALRDQATVGDLQAGIAWSAGLGAQMSFGLVERELSYRDIASDREIKTRENFAAFSFTLKR